MCSSTFGSRGGDGIVKVTFMGFFVRALLLVRAGLLLFVRMEFGILSLVFATVLVCPRIILVLHHHDCKTLFPPSAGGRWALSSLIVPSTQIFATPKKGRD